MGLTLRLALANFLLLFYLFFTELILELTFIYQPVQSHTQLSHNHSSRFVVVVAKLVVVVELVIADVLVVASVVENVVIVVVGFGIVVDSAAI